MALFGLSLPQHRNNMHTTLFEKFRHLFSHLFNIDISDKDTQISFWSGHFLTAGVVFTSMADFFLQSVARVFIAFSIGIIGGIGGLLAKDVYEWGKAKYEKKFKK